MKCLSAIAIGLKPRLHYVRPVRRRTASYGAVRPRASVDVGLRRRTQCERGLTKILAVIIPQSSPMNYVALT